MSVGLKVTASKIPELSMLQPILRVPRIIISQADSKSRVMIPVDSSEKDKLKLTVKLLNLSLPKDVKVDFHWSIKDVAPGGGTVNCSGSTLVPTIEFSECSKGGKVGSWAPGKYEVEVEFEIDGKITSRLKDDFCLVEYLPVKIAVPAQITVGDIVDCLVTPSTSASGVLEYLWSVDPATGIFDDEKKADPKWFTTDILQGKYTVKVEVVESVSSVPIKLGVDSRTLLVLPREVRKGDIVPISSTRTAAQRTDDLPLWVVIKKSTEAISFENYNRFLDIVLCGNPRREGENGNIDNGRNQYLDFGAKKFLPYNDVEAYRLLKVATEAFLMVNCGVAGQPFENPDFTQEDVEDLVRRVNVNGRGLDLSALNDLWDHYLKYVTNGTTVQTIPYLALVREKLRDSPLKEQIFLNTDEDDLPQNCHGIIREKLTNPCLLELIWSYWQEEGMLVQTLKAISMRFQNIRTGSGRDPLANMEIDALRPLNNLLWGLIQDEQHLLTVARRAYEYDHHYGISLFGKALPNMRPADSRSKFMEAFHNLLQLCSRFYMADDDTTVIADGFPMLNALKEVHLVLSEGAHNQFGDLPSTARVEMLMQQWLLSRPELREFLPTRMMVAYPEPWMDRVDAMKKVQGWTDTPVLHFRNLAMFGEKVLLSVRYGSWNNVEVPAQASNWARFWRAEIQGYIHAYRSVTGIDLTADVVNTRDAEQRFLPPSHHLRNRLQMQLKRA